MKSNIENQLPTDYQNFIALSRYARWKEDDQRRENWGETVDRYFDYMSKHLKSKHYYTVTKALKEKLTELYVKHNTAGKTYDDFMKDMDRDYFLSAEETIAYGLADKIEEKRK